MGYIGLAIMQYLCAFVHSVSSCTTSGSFPMGGVLPEIRHIVDKSYFRHKTICSTFLTSSPSTSPTDDWWRAQIFIGTNLTYVQLAVASSLPDAADREGCNPA